MRAFRYAALAVAAMLCAPASQAATFNFTEIEPNDSIASAQALVAPFGTGADQSATLNVFGSVAGEPFTVTDWYSFFIPPISDGVVFRRVAFRVFRGNLFDLPYRFTDANGTIIDPDLFATQAGGTYYLGIQNVGGASTYQATITISAIPEPATWALMLAGFGMVGYAMRRRRPQIVSA